MKRRRRMHKYQYVNGNLYNGRYLLLVENEPRKKETETTIIVLNDKALTLGYVDDEGCKTPERFILWHEPDMYWENYEKYFDDNVRIITAYPKSIELHNKKIDKDALTSELSKYIEENISGKIFLVGYAEAGILMLNVCKKLNETKRCATTAITVFSEFKNINVKLDKFNHIAFVDYAFDEEVSPDLFSELYFIKNKKFTIYDMFKKYVDLIQKK